MIDFVFLWDAPLTSSINLSIFGLIPNDQDSVELSRGINAISSVLSL